LLHVSGDVFGPYDMPFAEDDTGWGLWGSALRDAAISDGINLSVYDKIVYVTPRGGITGFSGAAMQNGINAWVFQCDNPHLYQHELGHTIGLHHASTEGDEYGDTTDFMGRGYSLKRLNAPHMHKLAWLSPETFQTITRAGYFRIAALDEETAAVSYPQALRIPGMEYDYFVSYRKPIGFASDLSAKELSKIYVHRSAYNQNTYLVASLGPKEVFRDSNLGINIKNVRASNIFMTTRVGIYCSRGQVAVNFNYPVLEGPTTGMAKPGGSYQYDITVTNNDTQKCGGSEFDVWARVPNGWTYELSSTTPYILPGESVTIELLVIPPEYSPDGTYVVDLYAKPSRHIQQRGTKASSGFIVDSIAPTSPSSFTASYNVVQEAVFMSWSPSEDNTYLDGYYVYRNGERDMFVREASAVRSVRTFGPPIEGLQSFVVQAVDGAGNVSGTSSAVLVDIPPVPDTPPKK
jgi:hypothetical protein